MQSRQMEFRMQYKTNARTISPPFNKKSSITDKQPNEEASGARPPLGETAMENEENDNPWLQEFD
jgi:hypothetical protein